MADSFTLQNKNGLILGLANDHSIAFGCMRKCLEAGANLAVTYQGPKSRPYVESAVKQLDSVQTKNLKILTECELTDDDQVKSLFDQITRQMGSLDFLIHCIAYAPHDDLYGRVVDCSRDGFLQAMDISCHSFIRLARASLPLMSKGGSMITMSYYGAEKVIENYNMMGPVKAALEASVRELASELGPNNIRVNAISPGPMPTRAAGGLLHFDQLQQQAIAKSPLHRLSNLEDVGALAVFLVGDASKAITGMILPVDAGYHIMG
ncbi:MAG: enoyl-[acyl-carrier-protein] reductase FabI [Alphaproteobacteria bacterium]|nr:MAG: enoyl-[acyl-carrier-protein] reductase FabI [Alphaproteobacteria bacterium]